MKTIEEINKKIKDGDAVVLTAEEMTSAVREKGAKKAAEEVDVVTTGTFGAMCSSGLFLNFGHSDPPIKMQKVFLNDVEAYGGLAAVDAYIGATQLSETRGFEYGGGHVIEDLLKGKEIELKATGYGTDCYPRKEINTGITLDDVNQAILFNPRNAYQNYNAATNGTGKTIYTYMSTLLANYGNVTYSTTGELSPLLNDPEFRTIGTGTRVYLAGAEGFVAWEGTQHQTKNVKHNGIPIGPAGNLSIIGDLREMNPKYLKGSTFHKYGTSLFVGIGIPIPVLDEDIARRTGVSNADIVTNMLDYGVPALKRPVVRRVNYEELRSGKIDVNGKEVKTSPLSSLYVAREIAGELKNKIIRGEFFLQEKIKPLPEREFKPLKIKKKEHVVADVMERAECVDVDTTLEDIARLFVEKKVDRALITENGSLKGIITTWDITKAFSEKINNTQDVITGNVITISPDAIIDVAARTMEKYKISSLPVIKDGKILGIITSENIAEKIKK